MTTTEGASNSWAYPRHMLQQILDNQETLADQQAAERDLLIRMGRRLAAIEGKISTLTEVTESGETRIEEIIMAASQADIDAITAAEQANDAAIQKVAAALTDDTSAIQAEIDTLKAQGVDVTALQAAVSQSAQDVSGALSDAATAIGNLKPADAPPADNGSGDAPSASV